LRRHCQLRAAATATAAKLVGRAVFLVPISGIVSVVAEAAAAITTCAAADTRRKAVVKDALVVQDRAVL
jgi:hypothetical protein